MKPWRVKMLTQNLLRLLLLLMVMLRNVLTTVWCKFGSWSLVIKLNFCFEQEKKDWWVPVRGNQQILYISLFLGWLCSGCLNLWEQVKCPFTSLIVPHYHHHHQQQPPLTQTLFKRSTKFTNIPNSVNKTTHPIFMMYHMNYIWTNVFYIETDLPPTPNKSN